MPIIVIWINLVTKNNHVALVSRLHMLHGTNIKQIHIGSGLTTSILMVAKDGQIDRTSMYDHFYMCHLHTSF
jgi:hypothetical protein